MACKPERLPAKNPLALADGGKTAVDRFDVSNRPEGHTGLRTRTDLRDLENLYLLLAAIEDGIPLDEDFIVSCKAAVAQMMLEARTVYRGRHPEDILLCPDDERPVTLYRALDIIRERAEVAFKMPKACTPFRPARRS